MAFDAELVPYCGGVYRVPSTSREIYQRKDRSADVPEDTRGDLGRRLVPGSLQYLSNGLSKMPLFLVEGNLA